MKRLSLLFLLTIVMGGMIFAQSIVVNHPSAGEDVVKGNAYTIQWTATGSMAATVKIRLFDSSNSSKIKDITDSTANNGSYGCPASIFNDVPLGNYVIRVKTTDNAVAGVSGVFHLVNAPSPSSATLTVTNPNSSSHWCKNNSYTITWNKSGTQAGTVKIRLVNSSGTTNILDITNSTANNGSFGPWTVPATIPNGHYKIKVKTTDNAVFDLSDTFEIKVCSDDGDGGDDGDDGSGIPWDRLEWLRDKLRRIKLIEWWRIHGPKPPWPGPDPCYQCPPEFNLGKLRELLAESGLKEQVVVELFKGGTKISELGKFGPEAQMSKGRTARMVRMNMHMANFGHVPVLQNKVQLRGLQLNKSKMLGTGDGYKLVIRNARGQVVFEQGIKLNEINRTNLRGNRMIK